MRQRAEAAIGDTVFVAPVPREPETDYRDTAIGTNEWMETYRAYRDRVDAAGDKRRYRLTRTMETFHAVADLDITGKTEFVDGVVVLDGVEKRYADHDHRLMVEHGIVPKETELIAGIIFWKKDGRPKDDA